MANTLYSAVKAYLEAQGLGIFVYRDAPAAGAKMPYVIFVGDVALRLHPMEDGATSTGAEEIQLDLYETWRGGDDKSAESASLADAITQKIHGTQVGYGAGNKRVYCLLQLNRTRQPNRDERIVHHVYQLDAVRQI